VKGSFPENWGLAIGFVLRIACFSLLGGFAVRENYGLRAGLGLKLPGKVLLGNFFRSGDSITWDSGLGCLRAGKMPVLQKLDVMKSSFLSNKHHQDIQLHQTRSNGVLRDAPSGELRAVEGDC